MLEGIEQLISIRDYQNSMALTEKLRTLALQGLHYFQTYDWLMLMTVITLGYLGWMVCLILHVLQSYTSLAGDVFMKQAAQEKNREGKVISK